MVLSTPTSALQLGCVPNRASHDVVSLCCATDNGVLAVAQHSLEAESQRVTEPDPEPQQPRFVPWPYAAPTRPVRPKCAHVYGKWRQGLGLRLHADAGLTLAEFEALTWVRVEFAAPEAASTAAVIIFRRHPFEVAELRRQAQATTPALAQRSDPEQPAASSYESPAPKPT